MISTFLTARQKRQKIRETEKPIPSIRHEIEQLVIKIKENKKLKDQNDKQLVAIQRQSYELKQKLRNAEQIQLQAPLDIEVFQEEMEKLTAGIREDQNTIDRKKAEDSDLEARYVKYKLA